MKVLMFAFFESFQILETSYKIMAKHEKVVILTFFG